MTSQPKSLLFAGAFPSPAALERYVSGDIAMRLQKLGWRVSVTSRAPGRLGRLCGIVSDIWRARAEYDLACVDVFSGPAFVWAEVACMLLKRLGKRYVLTLHGGSLPDFAQRHPRRVGKLLGSAAAVACPSPYLLAQMRGLRKDLILLPNGLDLSRYPFRERHPPFRHLVWLRAFHDIYNPELAVETIARLRQRSDMRLTMIGPDKKDRSLERTRQAAARLGVEGAVRFRGPVAKQDVPNELARGDIFLNTTNFDNTPVSVLEAMACGLPVVTTNVGGIPYLLKHGETALLAPPRDAGALAESVVRLLHEPGLSARLAMNGRKMAEGFDWAVILPQWERLLASLTPASRAVSGDRAGAKRRSSESLSHPG